jgi:hypothetical protein
MTQQNAALVEQSAAAAESLREQADRLASVVRQFRLSDQHASAGQATRRGGAQGGYLGSSAGESRLLGL